MAAQNKLAEQIEALPGLREVVESHGLMAKKALGQNFLLDRNITDKIIRLSLDKQNLRDFSGAHVFEIGPGPGGLTRSILRAAPDQLTVIEMDNRCIQIMEEIRRLTNAPLQIINADALQQDLIALGKAPRHIVSNLPYNISVPLLFKWLTQIDDYASLTLMFQKEVADRITAAPGSKDYGRVSILAQLLCQIDRLFDLNPNCFVPAPKIWSTVLLFQPLHSGLKPKELKRIEHLTSLAFGQRRKMIRQSLKTIPELEAKLHSLGLNGTLRAEQLTPQQYLEFSRLI